MRLPGDPDNGALRGGAVHSPADATTLDAGAPGASAAAIFPPQRSDNRTRQLEETWSLLFRELRGPVDSTLLGGLSAGDVAYRLGELVHNYFRTRGVTLTSFELRRIVVELLDNHKHGWPTLKPAQGPNAPPSSLVDFVDGDPDARAIREAAQHPPAPATSKQIATPVIEPIPSPLVDLQPRGTPQQAPPTMSSLSVESAGPGVAVRSPPPRATRPPPPRRRPMPDLSPPRERDETLTPEQLASMEAAAAEAAEAAFGAEPAAPTTSPAPAAEAPKAAPGEMTAEAALAAIAPAWEKRRATKPMPTNRAELTRWVAQTTSEALADTGVRLSAAERTRLDQLVMDEVFGLGPIEALLRDAAVTSIMINGPGAAFVERRGQIERVGGFRDEAHVASLLDRLARFAGKNPTGAPRPVIEGRLPDSSRFVIVAPPLAPLGPHCTITRRPAPVATLDDLVARDALSAPMATLLRAAARGRLNILVSGRADSGRTTLLSALARAAARDERVVTVERRVELRLDLPNVVSLVAPEAKAETSPVIDLAMAVDTASRLRPDRVVIDGLGNGAVARLVTLVDSGRDGVLASCEATSPRAALEELAQRVAESEPQETLATARRRVAGVFDLVLHLEAFRDGRRRVTHIAEVTGADGESIAVRDLFSYDPDSIRPDGRSSGRFVSAGHRPFFLPRLAKLGLDKAVIDAI